MRITPATICGAWKECERDHPCVVGPYTGVNCTLTLLSDKTRIKSTPVEALTPEHEDERGRSLPHEFDAMQAIATNGAQNDSGLFEFNFRDERYLPFEGAGAVSGSVHRDAERTLTPSTSTRSRTWCCTWKYTARDGGEILRQAVEHARREALAEAENAPLARLFSLKHEFPIEWYRFLHPVDVEASIRPCKSSWRRSASRSSSVAWEYDQCA